MYRYLCLLFVTTILLGGCVPVIPVNSSPVVPSTEMPVPLKIGTPMSDGDGLTVTVFEHSILPEIDFRQTSDFKTYHPAVGYALHIVVVDMELERGERKIPLDIDKIVVTTEDSAKIPVFAMSYESDQKLTPPDMVYMYLNKNGEPFDFGLGFTGLALSMRLDYSPNGDVIIEELHGPNPVRLFFAFEVLEAHTVTAFQFDNFPPVLLLDN